MKLMSTETIVETILTELEKDHNCQLIDTIINHNLNQEDVYSAFLSKGIDMSEWND